ncbi:MAG: hypothetical protein [Bacteriophage sp.]|nr:MAG: hypothetical protein [Bacteriophage sp.]
MARTVTSKFTDIESAIEEAVYRKYANTSETQNYGVISVNGMFETRRVRACRPQEFIWTTEGLVPRCLVLTNGSHTVFVDLDKKDITVTKGEIN